MFKNLVKLLLGLLLLFVLGLAVFIFYPEFFWTSKVDLATKKADKTSAFEAKQQDDSERHRKEVFDFSGADLIKDRVVARGDVTKEFIPENQAMKSVVPLDAKTLEELINFKKQGDRNRELDAIKSPFD